LDKVKKERESTNEATNNSTISINETNNKIKDLLSLVGLQEEEIKTLKTEIRELIKSNKDQMEYNEKKLGTIIELLKIYISNNKEAVRTGVAETVNKLANEV
jgi:type I site-specific restriction endonuclease